MMKELEEFRNTGVRERFPPDKAKQVGNGRTLGWICEVCLKFELILMMGNVFPAKTVILRRSFSRLKRMSVTEIQEK